LNARTPAAVVTGAARGIGRVVALTLAERGYRVAANDLAEPEATLTELRDAGATALSLPGDVSDEEVVRGMVQTVVDGFGLRNIDTNSRVDLNLNSNAHGGDVVRAEGVAGIVEDAPPASEVPEYVEKYSAAIARIGFDPEGFALAYSVPLRITPTRWQVW
jgi:NAD(P)-dependent dehydrogenase (short-subunit alcohol dehydrogenase family)